MAGESGEHSAPLIVWVAVAVIVAGSIVAGIALIEWWWPVFYVGIGLIVAGSIGGYFVRIMDQVTEYAIVSVPMTEIEQS